MPAGMTSPCWSHHCALWSTTRKAGRDFSLRLNQRMIGRTKGGFTTCLITAGLPNGAMTIASAGHQMPYVDGREIAGDTGLPLGFWLTPPTSKQPAG